MWRQPGDVHAFQALAQERQLLVEQEDWAVVRRAAGYLRYDTPAELRVLRELYTYLVPYVNFFQPHMELVSKTRAGAKVNAAMTPRRPNQRILAAEHVDEVAKEALRKAYPALNPMHLKRQIGRCQAKLLNLARRRKVADRPGVVPGHPWYGNHDTAASSRAS